MGKLAYLQRIAQLEALVYEQAQLIEQQAQALTAQAERIAELEGRLKLDSRTSHRPPSTDGPRKAPASTSNRTPSERKPGGQVGHTGSNLKQVPADQVDHRVEHRPESCCGCGCSLEGQPSARIAESRQVWDLPPVVRLEVTEHQALEVPCPRCQCLNRGSFPLDVRGPAQYGSRIAALGLTLYHEHAVALRRVCSLLTQLVGRSFSPATLVSLTRRAGQQAALLQARHEAALQASPVSHADETGIRVAGRNGWVHAWTNGSTVILLLNRGRGFAAMEHLHQYAGTLIHDCWRSYFKLTACGHGLCNAHLLRELTRVDQQGQGWAGQLATLLVLAWKVAQAARLDQGLDPRMVRVLVGEYERLVAEGLAAQPPPPPREAGQRGPKAQTRAYNLLKRLESYQDMVLRFLHEDSVPFDNNAGERSIRMLKVLMHVFYCFRTEAGARYHLALRSGFMTARNQGEVTLPFMQKLYASYTRA